jgi:hypothetical protein
MWLELDHIVCMVDDLDRIAARLEQDLWPLDAGVTHPGEGTRNRRLLWPEQHLELLSVVDPEEARSSALGLDRRAGWRLTGASPFGLGFRGALTGLRQDDFWLHEEDGVRFWIHHDNERAPECPLVFVIEAAGEALERRRPRTGHRELMAAWDGPPLHAVHISGPQACALPQFQGPPVTQAHGPHHLELVIGTAARAVQISPVLTLRV